MPFPAHFFCSYLTTSDAQWRPDDYSAMQFTKAVKGRPFKGYARVPTSGGLAPIYQEDTAKAIQIFAEWAAKVVQSNVGEGSITLVPVPSSAAIVGTPSAGTALSMATAIAERLRSRALVADVLRWTEAMNASSHGGTRDAQVLFEHLTVIGQVQGAHVVIVDDVCTTQGHMRAAAARLKKGAKAQVELAVCAGRTNQVQPENPFEQAPETVPDFTPTMGIFGRRQG